MHGSGRFAAHFAKDGQLGFDVRKTRAHGPVQPLARFGGRHAASSAVQEFEIECRSNARTVWLSADCERPSCAAARVKLLSRTTAAKAARSSKRAIDKYC